MYHFCTLFDSAYMSRGLALYESLVANCGEFLLFILPFDERSRVYLDAARLPNVQVIDVQDFEDAELRAAKSSRSRVEYYWTCTPSLIRYCLQRFELELCTYLDADTYFFADPGALLAQLGDESVMITPHRYTPRYDKTLTSGKYCVQFMPFRNDRRGWEVLERWRAACLEVCTMDPGRGLCGDQMYLDDWLQVHDGVMELRDLGGGVAPWNVQQYELVREGDRVVGRVVAGGERFELNFYHFQGLRYIWKRYYLLGTQVFRRTLRYSSGYDLPDSCWELVYRPYLKHLARVGRQISHYTGEVERHGAQVEDVGFIPEAIRVARNAVVRRLGQPPRATP